MRRPLLSRARHLSALLALAPLACTSTDVPKEESATSKNELEMTGPRLDAMRFLSQATFGARLGDAQSLIALGGNEAWLRDQFTKSPAPMLATVEALDPPTWTPNTTTNTNQTFQAVFFTRAITSGAQLRLRVAFALSEIFVISFRGSNLGRRPAGFANYHDLLTQHAFGNYRDVLGAVSTNPMMGLYLSSLHNDKASANFVPDENYAREVMQLFSIGLYELNADGTLQLDATGKPIETYTQDDITNLARVFTGWSWNCGTPTPTEACFRGATSATPERRDVLPMQPNPAHHSPEPKSFLGITIPGNATPEQAMERALNRLANHHNTGPFIGKQLIQRLVTSNPSKGYVSRVTRAFNTGSYTDALGGTFGGGVRGDLQAVIAAVLLDPEARSLEGTQKLREPVLALTAYLRAFRGAPLANDGSTTSLYRIANTVSPTALGQMPYFSPTVFNFYRPGFSPGQTELNDAGLVAPEFQIASEVSVAGYANFMRSALLGGVPVIPTELPDGGTLAYPIKPDFTPELALAHDSDALVRRVRFFLTGERMSTATFDAIKAAVDLEPLPAPPADDSVQRLNRVRIAVYLTLISPDFLVQ